jgi:hypothetical protein
MDPNVLRNLLAHVGPAQRAMVAAAIGTVFTQENHKAARRQRRQVADRLRARFAGLPGHGRGRGCRPRLRALSLPTA